MGLVSFVTIRSALLLSDEAGLASDREKAEYTATGFRWQSDLKLACLTTLCILVFLDLLLL